MHPELEPPEVLEVEVSLAKLDEDVAPSPKVVPLPLVPLLEVPPAQAVPTTTTNARRMEGVCATGPLGVEVGRRPRRRGRYRSFERRSDARSPGSGSRRLNRLAMARMRKASGTELTSSAMPSLGSICPPGLASPASVDGLRRNEEPAFRSRELAAATRAELPRSPLRRPGRWPAPRLDGRR